MTSSVLHTAFNLNVRFNLEKTRREASSGRSEGVEIRQLRCGIKDIGIGKKAGLEVAEVKMWSFTVEIPEEMLPGIGSSGGQRRLDAPEIEPEKMVWTCPEYEQ